jgi:hypothetical protein
MMIHGKWYLVQTITWYWCGEFVEWSDGFAMLRLATQIPDTGRLADAFRSGQFAEVEPLPDGVPVMIPREVITAVIPWNHPLPRTQQPQS